MFRYSIGVIFQSLFVLSIWAGSTGKGNSASDIQYGGRLSERIDGKIQKREKTMFALIKNHGGIRFCFMARDYVSRTEGERAYAVIKPSC